ncbi:unnamed protein product [Ceratitis capitata]|uniref:(Mediterranean fruit fly) hypothetical protein n=1 Tax=Ceratitis capitata TaxID=7213 RepID=A0A811V1U3_CERCA|nr:unnamed protein product [Ceratitis capitata]
MWVYGAIMVSEAILCIKNGKELFEHTQGINIVLWLITQVVVSVAFVYGCMLWQRAQEKYKKSTDSPSKKGKTQNTLQSEEQGKKSPKKSPKRHVQKIE